ncbi:signal peptidase I [Cytobacillus horneckiae]|uniref:signal peptidase I n=1 Tax=Cytobacillus horneckiae TaxID=549687 RepID=UPI0034CE1300
MIKVNKGYIVVLAIILILFTLFIELSFTPVKVKGSSMLPTFNENDRLIIEKANLSDIKRNDIVIFKDINKEKYYLKRIIGVPGDHLEIIDNEIFVNEQKIEDFCSKDENKNYTFSSQNPIEDITVPEGEYFVLGDNFDHSKDSRHIGTVPFEQIRGKGILVYWPLKDIQIIN